MMAEWASSILAKEASFPRFSLTNVLYALLTASEFAFLLKPSTWKAQVCQESVAAAAEAKIVIVMSGKYNHKYLVRIFSG